MPPSRDIQRRPFARHPNPYLLLLLEYRGAQFPDPLFARYSLHLAPVPQRTIPEAKTRVGSEGGIPTTARSAALEHALSYPPTSSPCSCPQSSVLVRRPYSRFDLGSCQFPVVEELLLVHSVIRRQCRARWGLVYVSIFVTFIRGCSRSDPCGRSTERHPLLTLYFRNKLLPNVSNLALSLFGTQQPRISVVSMATPGSPSVQMAFSNSD